jgi:uncharacterized protein
MSEDLTEKDALRLLREAGCDEEVVKHSVAVSNLAYELACKAAEKGYPVNVHLVKLGGLLHDIGRSVTHKVDHGVKGGEIARKLKLPPKLVRIVECHVGAGIPEGEAQVIGLPRRSYMPETLEEKIVCYADKLIKGKNRATFQQAMRDMINNLGSNHPAVRRLIDLHETVSKITG